MIICACCPPLPDPVLEAYLSPIHVGHCISCGGPVWLMECTLRLKSDGMALYKYCVDCWGLAGMAPRRADTQKHTN